MPPTVIAFRASQRRRNRQGWRLTRFEKRTIGSVLFAALAIVASGLEDSDIKLDTLLQNAASTAAQEPVQIQTDAGFQLRGRPSAITDGDTLRLGATRIRLHGIDAPEMSTTQGPLARTHLAQLIGGRTVSCHDTGGRSYDRVVAVCYSAEGRDLSAWMVADGWATDWAKFSGGRYAEVGRRARREGLGMYGG